MLLFNCYTCKGIIHTLKSQGNTPLAWCDVCHAPSVKHRIRATATPIKAPTGPATSAYSSSQSISAVNGFMLVTFRLVVIL